MGKRCHSAHTRGRGVQVKNYTGVYRCWSWVIRCMLTAIMVRRLGEWAEENKIEREPGAFQEGSRDKGAYFHAKCTGEQDDSKKGWKGIFGIC